MVKLVQIRHMANVSNKDNTFCLKKRAWSEEEDKILTQLINKHGPYKWSYIASQMGDRMGKQCRERWHNHLNPRISKDDWTSSEEWNLYLAQQLFGNKWADISRRIKGRTDNSIKNHWNSTMRKKREIYRQNLLNAIFIMQNSPQKFAKRYPLNERLMIKEISRQNLVENKISEKKTPNFDSQVISNNLNLNEVLKNIQNLHSKLFDEEDFVEELYKHTLGNNLSYFQMISLFDFIEANEEKITEVIDQEQTGNFKNCCSQMSENTEWSENGKHICTHKNASNKLNFDFRANQNSPALLIPTCFVNTTGLMISRNNYSNYKAYFEKTNTLNFLENLKQNKNTCMLNRMIRDQRRVENFKFAPFQ